MAESNKLSQYSDRAHYYDIEFNDSSDRKILESIVDSVGGRVLEIPSGSGRNMWLVHKSYISPVFADIDESMVEQLTSKLAADNHGVAVQADMTDLNIGEFDLILVPREGLQLLPKLQLLKTLIGFRESLKEGGFIYIDIAKLRAPFSSSDHPVYITQQDVWHVDIDTYQENVHFVRKHKSHLEDEKLYVEYNFKIEDREGLHQFSTSIELTEYSIEELREVLTSTRFDIKVIYGNYEMKPYEPTDDRMIFLAQKGI